MGQAEEQDVASHGPDSDRIGKDSGAPRGTAARTATAVRAVAAIVIAIVAGAPAAAQQPPRADRHRVPADYMSYLGADWLERAERADEEQPERVLDATGLRSGDVAADVGCGSGYYARRMARRVRPAGKVYCEDIQPEMLDIMRRRAADEGVTGIEAVLGSPTDPRLPPGAVDWVLIADAYHEMSDPEPMLAGIRRALAPGGQVALLEYRVEDGTGDWIKADHAMSVRQVLTEWKAAGFELAALHDFLPSQHLFFFRPAGEDAAGDALADHDLFEALDAGLIEVEARGAGADAVTLRVRRTNGQPLVVTSPVATWFEADGARDMVARRDGWIVLDGDEWRDWPLRAVGRSRDRDPPGPDRKLALRPPSAIPRIEAVLRQAQAGTYFLGDSPTLYLPRFVAVEEAAVRIADGDERYAALAASLGGTRIPPEYAVAFALVAVDRAGIDVMERRVWADRDAIFGRLRDPGLRAWRRTKTTGRD